MEQKKSVVIVDDEVDTSQMAKMILEQSGLCTVTVCNRGSEALKVILEKRPDLVLLDIVMPDADGTDIAIRMKDEKALASTKIVFMTSLVSEQETAKQSVIGGHPFISKPISGETLLKKVKGFLGLGN